MNKQLFSFVLIFVSLTSYSQEWAPIGATWYYSSYVDMRISYKTIVSEKDTIIQGKNCNKLSHQFPDNRSATTITYAENDSVYFLFENEFYLFMDFTSDLGDSTTLYFLTIDTSYNDTVIPLKGIVSAVDTTSVGSGCKHITVSLDSVPEDDFHHWPSQVAYAERLGNTSSNGSVLHDIDAGNFTLGNPPHFRCYQDHKINYISSFPYPCDYKSTVGSEEYGTDTQFQLRLHPNPNNGTFVLHWGIDVEEPSALEIYDPKGRLILKQQYPKNGQDISLNKPKGIYIIRLKNKDHATIYTEKFIITK